MIKIKYALRFLSRQKAFTLINILGLTLSLACGIVLSRYLYREVTAESHAIDPETMLVAYQENGNFGRVTSNSVQHLKDYYNLDFGKKLDEFMVEHSDFILYPEVSLSLNDQSFFVNAMVVDSLFLHFFDYKIEGDRNAMTRPDGCWVSRRVIPKLGLDEQHAIGTAFNLSNYNFVIAGIFDEPACKAIYTPDIMLSKMATEFWERMGSSVIRIPKDADVDAFNAYMLPLQADKRKDKHIIFWGEIRNHQFIRWNTFYLDQTSNAKWKENVMEHHGNPTVDWILVAVMLLILVIGMMNFTNLYMVYWQRRQREQGIRRVFGQKAKSLFLEMWTELFISTIVAVGIAWLLVDLFTPWTNEMLNDEVSATPFDLVLTLGFLVLLPLISLCYPFFQQLKSSTLVSLQQRVGSVQNLRSRTALLACQYLITFILVVMAIWMQNHLNFLLNSPIGSTVDNILLAKPLHIKEGYMTNEGVTKMEFVSNAKEVEQMAKFYLAKLKESALIENATVVDDQLPISQNRLEKFYNDKDEDFQLAEFHVSPAWFDVFGVELLEGNLMDSSDYQQRFSAPCWVVNETALRQLGYETKESGMLRSEEGTGIAYDTETQEIIFYGKDKMPIIGIIKDHYTGHRTLGITPCVYWIDSSMDRYAYPFSRFAIKVKPGHEKEIIELLEKISQELCPDQELEYHWFREDVEKLYEEDKLMTEVYTLFSGIAIVICCLGLLGLSLFDIRQRYREIAIRKANGSHRKDLYLLLARKYLWVLVGTFVLSIPISYLFIQRYTEEFIECAPITPWIYLEALVLVVLITVLTLIYQMEKAARVNVSKVIKSE